MNVRKFLVLTVFSLCLLPCIAQNSEGFRDFDLVTIAPKTNEVYGKFTIGENVQSFTARRWVKAFAINRYETTYSLWYEVLEWATNRGYLFQNPGQEGSAGRRGRLPTQMRQYQPVTMISWYDVIVWCNALSEMKGRTPCYTYSGEVLRDATDTLACDLAECNWEADGFRLPTETEWEYAARKTLDGVQRGDLASGQTSELEAEDVAWYSDNATTAHVVGTAGTPFDLSASPAPGSGNANGSGLFDMSGNVLEFCWDWEADYEDTEPEARSSGPRFGSQRVCRGGSWSPYSFLIFAADRYAFDPNEAYNYLGFRFCTSFVE